MATATPQKRKKRRTVRSLAGFPDQKQLVPVLKAVGMLALGLTAGYAANDMIGSAMKSDTVTEGFNIKGLIAPVLTVAAGMMLVSNPTTKYAGLGLSAAGALKAVAVVIKKDPLTLPELRFIKNDTAALPAATSTPVQGIGNVPYLEFDDEEEESEQNVEGFGKLPQHNFL